ncbi:uncharacterized protein BT62DRAFT_923907 [Guyanagaster necrorhizus]|uniref:Uncharacterized protein n=1 Tax=Guyanagaster necrorhizus TaxID=856835 RepID=A0A9P7VGJ8_9AGAR|nr:uncharacterized protein BT62DRAFT_923907 [Guyanagaster necrorhizus MCA 3950]KAG7440593.1 hypothetical protein BT62DRAFT_923907 [Guyanagaster necrorhizus MCA 3950]
MPYKGLDFENGFVFHATSVNPLNKQSACSACPLHCSRWYDPQRLYPSQYRLLRDKVAENQHKWRKAEASARETEERAKDLEGRIDLYKEETAKVKDEEIRDKTERIQIQDKEIGLKDERIRLMEEEIRRKDEEIRRKDEEIGINVKAIHATDEYRRKDKAARLLSERCRSVEQGLLKLRAENASLRRKIYDDQEEKEMLSKEQEATKDILGATDLELTEARAMLSSKQAELVNNTSAAMRVVIALRKRLLDAEKEAQKKLLDAEEKARQEVLETEGKVQELTKELAASQEAETHSRTGHERVVEKLISKLEEVSRVAAEREREMERLGAALNEAFSQGKLVSERCRELEMRPPVDESYQRILEEERSIAVAMLRRMDEEMSLMKEAGMQLIVENQTLSGEVERLQGWKADAWRALEQQVAVLREMEGDLSMAREGTMEVVERNRMLLAEVDSLRPSNDTVMASPSDAAHLSQMIALALQREADLNRVKEELARSREREKQAMENLQNLSESHKKSPEEPQEQPNPNNDCLYKERYRRLVTITELIHERISRAKDPSKLDLSQDIDFLDMHVRLDIFEDIKHPAVPWPISSGVKVDDNMELEWKEEEEEEEGKEQPSLSQTFSASLSLHDVDTEPLQNVGKKRKDPTWRTEVSSFLGGFSESLCPLPKDVDTELECLERIREAFDLDMWGRENFMQKSEENKVREMCLLVAEEVDRAIEKAVRKKQLFLHR